MSPNPSNLCDEIPHHSVESQHGWLLPNSEQPFHGDARTSSDGRLQSDADCIDVRQIIGSRQTEVDRSGPLPPQLICPLTERTPPCLRFGSLAVLVSP